MATLLALYYKRTPSAAGQDKTDVFGSIILHIVRVSAYIPVAAAYALLSARFCVSVFLWKIIFDTHQVQ